MAHFGTEKASIIGRKCVFAKMTLHHLGCSNMHSEPFLRLFVAILRLHLALKPLEMLHLGIKRGSKKGTCFPASDSGHPRMPEHMLWPLRNQKRAKLPGKTLQHIKMHALFSVPELGPNTKSWSGLGKKERFKKLPPRHSVIMVQVAR